MVNDDVSQSCEPEAQAKLKLAHQRLRPISKWISSGTQGNPGHKPQVSSNSGIGFISKTFARPHFTPSPKATCPPLQPPSEVSLATLVRTADEARRAVDLLRSSRVARNVHACDTETTGVDPTEESPVGRGRVICLTIYSGPHVDFSSCGNNIEVRDSPSTDSPTASINEGTAAISLRGEHAHPEDGGTAAATDYEMPPPPRVRRSSRLWVDTAGPESAGVWAALRPWLEDPAARKVWHNYGFDRHVLANHGVACRGFWGDTLHMARLWDASRTLGGGGYSLAALSQDLLPGWAKQDMKRLFGRAVPTRSGQPGRRLVLPDPAEIQGDADKFEAWVNYATKDSLCTYHLYHLLRQRLQAMEWRPDPAFLRTPAQGGAGPGRGLTMLQVYEGIWRPFGELLTEIEAAGMQLDCGHLEQQAERAERDRRAAEDKFMAWAASLGADNRLLNIGSSLQKRHLLFSSLPVKFLKDHEVGKHKYKAGEVYAPPPSFSRFPSHDQHHHQQTSVPRKPPPRWLLQAWNHPQQR